MEQKYNSRNTGKKYTIGDPFPTWISPIENRQLINIREYSWDYTPELKRAIMIHNRDLNDVSKAANAFNRLLRPVHGPFKLYTTAGEKVPTETESEFGYVKHDVIDVNSLED
ncbi:hypothetical protein KG088_17695 [Halomonas sp. TRM85114]|uniref:hypothetical protein n=1 Tax=Halomonas jincaotanensis TaxID=2810616 RepID=UPI001BD4F60C|nr:hypothetical protein [Halomonas jincaotanensis]MBS9405442.1 hypothetical protein [Halomonas jincaotanensis]